MTTELAPQKKGNVVEEVRRCVREKRYRLTEHALMRHEIRQINMPTIRHILMTGIHDPADDRLREAFNRWSYAIVGTSLDGEKIKIVVSFPEEEDLMFIVTVMYIYGRGEV